MSNPSIFANLPDDIIREHILPYTYHVQSKSLLEDISTFFTMRDFLLDFYNEKYSAENPAPSLSNDIDRFMNQDIPLMFGYSDKHYSIWRRLFYFQDKSEMFVYDITMEIDKKINSFACVNIKLGALTPSERADLMTFIGNINYL